MIYYLFEITRFFVKKIEIFLILVIVIARKTISNFFYLVKKLSECIASEQIVILVVLIKKLRKLFGIIF